MNSAGCDPQPSELSAFSFSDQEFCSPCCGCWSFPVFNLLELKHTFTPKRVLLIKSHLMPVHATCLIRADPMSVVRRSSLLKLPAALFNIFCLWNSAPPLSIASLTAFDHAVTRFTPLSDHSYVILEVRVVHCRHSGGSCRAFSA